MAQSKAGWNRVKCKTRIGWSRIGRKRIEQDKMDT